MFRRDLILSLACKGHVRLPAGKGRDRMQSRMNIRGQAGPGGEKNYLMAAERCVEAISPHHGAARTAAPTLAPLENKEEGSKESLPSLFDLRSGRTQSLLGILFIIQLPLS